MMTDVTVIGLGAMGSALATTFLERGLRVTVWNRSPEKGEALTARGAQQADGVAAAITASPLTVVSLLDYPAVSRVLETATEALHARTLVNLTNGTPAEARALAEWVERHDGQYLDGAVMVTPDMVGGPEACLLYSGARDVYSAHEGTLSLLGSGVWTGAEPGRAALHDLALLSAMFGMFGGFLHAAALLKSDRIPATEVTPMITELLHAMVDLLPQTASEIDSGIYPQPSSNNTMMAAALRNIVSGSAEQGVRPDLMEPLKRLFDHGVAGGLGAKDISALVPLLE